MKGKIEGVNVVIINRRIKNTLKGISYLTGDLVDFS